MPYVPHTAEDVRRALDANPVLAPVWPDWARATPVRKQGIAAAARKARMLSRTESFRKTDGSWGRYPSPIRARRPAEPSPTRGWPAPAPAARGSGSPKTLEEQLEEIWADLDDVDAQHVEAVREELREKGIVRPEDVEAMRQGWQERIRNDAKA